MPTSAGKISRGTGSGSATASARHSPEKPGNTWVAPPPTLDLHKLHYSVKAESNLPLMSSPLLRTYVHNVSEMRRARRSANVDSYGRNGGTGGEGECLVLARSSAQDAIKKGDGRDIWRNSLLRYAGYANEVGESFRFVAPGLVVPSYAVSIAYVCGDTADKAYKEYCKGKGGVAAAKMGLDVMLWQTLASVAVPGLTINVAVKAVTRAMASDQAQRVVSKVARKWIPTAVGLGVIPFIVEPIDETITWGMDQTVRKWLGTESDAADT